MRNLRCIALALLLAPILAVAGERAEVAGATREWQEAVNSRDARKIASLYDHEALLYATFRTRIDNPGDLLEYFEHLVENENLRVKFHRQDIRIFAENCAINSGSYTFSYREHGKPVSIPARYTFVYIKENGSWKIIEHHSSVNPER